MFDVYSGTNAEPYVVDLAGEHDRCTCPDVEHNLEAGERCKHARRVRLEFGLAPFENVPQVRDEHVAPMDVELARRRRGIDAEPQLEPKPITVADAKSARAVIMDGETVVSTSEPHPQDVETGLPEITTEVEPPEQGGAAYLRCSGCGREVIGTDETRLSHRETCAHSGVR